MKHFKAIIVTVMLALAVTLLPKASWASDVSVGVFFGIPFPIVAIAPPPPIHHPVPGFFIPPPFYHREHVYAPSYRHHGHYGYRNYERRYWKNHHENWRRDYGKRDWGHGNNDHRDDDRGNYGRGNDHRR